MRTIVDLPDEQINALKIISEQEHVSRAELIRRAVQSFISEKAHTDKSAFGLWSNRYEDGVKYQNHMRDEWES